MPRLIQRFEVLEQIGVGGMGTVYRARDPQLERDVAIKLVGTREPETELAARTLDLRAPNTTRDALLAEARVMAQLSHPNVLPVFEVGLHEGALFLVMEHIAGADLRAWLVTKPSPTAIRHAFVQAGHGLAAAHARGIVHRDLKPDNILVGDDGRVRVADFGLSNLAPAHHGMVRMGNPIGTLEYMAPEVRRGEPATISSDVYAFALSLAEAMCGRYLAPNADLDDELRRAHVEPSLRAAIRAALHDDPMKRPGLDALVSAVEHRARGRRIAVAAAVASLAGLGYVVATRGGNESCELDRSMLDARRAELSGALGDAASDALTWFDRRADEISSSRQHACQAAETGELTDAELHAQTSCLDRRAIELGATVHRAVAIRASSRDAADLAFGLASIPACRELVLPPLPADASRVASLIERYVMTGTHARPEQLADYQAIERDATALGEAEIEVRAAIAAGFQLRDRGQVAAAVDAFRGAHKRALEIHATDLAAVALLERSNIAGEHGDVAGARSLAGLALDLVDKPSVTMWTRARIHEAVARVDRERAEYRSALAHAEDGRQTPPKSGRMSAWIETLLRQDQMQAMLHLDGSEAAALALARDNLDYARASGIASHAAAALTDLAQALHKNRRFAEAADTRRHALAALAAVYGADHADVQRIRAMVAADDMEAGRYRDARTEFQSLLAASEHVEALRDRHSLALWGLAEADYYLGDHGESIRLLDQSIDEATSLYGKDHPETLRRLNELVDFATDLGRLDDATRGYDRLERARRERPDTQQIDIAVLHGILGTNLANARGKPREAEALAREALTTLRELALDSSQDAALIRYGLAQSLVAQKRWPEALAAADASLEIAKARSMREDLVAVFQLPWIAAAIELGRHDDALTRARDARAVLVRYPGQPSGLKLVDQLLARLAPMHPI